VRREREAKGRCFADMVLRPGYCAPEERTATTTKGIHQFTYQFTRAPSERTGTENSLLNGHMSCGDAISVSVEPDLVALTRGFIVELTPYEVVVGVDHELCVEDISRRLDAFWRASGRGGGRVVGLKGVVFRIDKDEMFGGMGRIRDNLAQLFYADGDSRRLSLVVDLTPPVFTTETAIFTAADNFASKSKPIISCIQSPLITRLYSHPRYAWDRKDDSHSCAHSSVSGYGQNCAID